MEEVLLIYGNLDILDVDDCLNGEKHSALNAIQGKSFPPLGLLYLAAFLEKEKIRVKLLDIALLKEGFKDVLYLARQLQPCVIGIYTSSLNLRLVALLIPQLRIICEKSKIVIGGPHVHYCPDSVNYLGADYGFVSDGEIGFSMLVKKLLHQESNVADIPNLVRKVNGRAEIGRTEKIKDLDSLPFPARNLWPHQNYFSPLVRGRSTSAIFSRGCIFSCKFCALPDKGSFRARSVGNVIDELIFLQGQGFNSVEFQDDFFTYNRDRSEEFCRQLIKKKIKLRWTCLTRADYVDSALLVLMKRARCTHIKFGVEFGSEYIRNNVMKKSLANGEIKEKIRQTRKAGIFSVGYFLLGAREESLGDMESTIKFSRELGLDYVDFNLMALIPGSSIFQESVDEGLVPNNVWEEVAKGRPIPYSLPAGISREKLDYLKEKAMKKYYLNPVFFAREFFFRTKSPGDLLNKLKILINMMRFQQRVSGFTEHF